MRRGLTLGLSGFDQGSQDKGIGEDEDHSEVEDNHSQQLQTDLQNLSKVDESSDKSFGPRSWPWS